MLFCARFVLAGQGPDLSIAYTDGVTHIAPGGALIYTLTITNNSNFAATNASASATLPNFAAFTSSANGGVFANGSVTFSNLSVPANGTLTLQFTATIATPLAAGTAHSFSSIATVSVDPAQGVDPNLANNSATDTDSLDLAPDPVICNVTDGVACSFANGILTYVMTCCNQGNIGITGVVVTNTIPFGTTFVSADNGGTYANGVVTWPAYSIAGGVQTFRSVTVKVNSPLPPGVVSLTDVASISDDGTNGADVNPLNNTNSDTDCVQPSADVMVTKTVDIPNPNIGDTIVYTVVATNNGPDAASNVTATDQLPAGLTLIAVTQTAGTYDTSSGAWIIGPLANGASATLTLTATVNANPPKQIDNTACVSNSPEADSDPTNNCATVSIDPSCGRQPSITSGPLLNPLFPIVGIEQTMTIGFSDNGSGIPVVVTWDFGDGSFGTGSPAQHIYAAPGTYAIKVVAANFCGGVGTSLSFDLVVAPVPPPPKKCSLLRATFNYARPDSDSLALVAEVDLPTGYNPAGKTVTVQVGALTVNAVLNRFSQYKDGNTSVAIKPLGLTSILALKIVRSSLSGRVVPNLVTTAKLEVIKDTPFFIQVGTQSFGETLDVTYTGKRKSGVLSK